MIYYNSNTINDWNFGDDNIAKVYYGVTNTSRLPSGYTEVEYIQRDASHDGYVGLGEYFQENTKIEIDFQMTQAKGNAIIGDYGSNDKDDWRVFLNYDSQVNNLMNYDFLATRIQSNTGDWSKRFHIEIGNYYIKDLDSGSYIVQGTSKSNFTRPNQMYLFHMNGSQNTNNIDYGKIYSVKIWQNNTLVKDFVSCFRNSDNVVGLYDIVGNEFHGSLESTLIAGSAVTPSSMSGRLVYQKITNGSTPPTPPTPPIDYANEYLTFVAQSDGVTISLSDASTNIFQYSLDSGSTWNNLVNKQSTPSINNGDKIMFKASGLTVNTEKGIGTLHPSASASVEGNVMSLIYGDDFSGQTAIPNNYQFRRLFSGVTTITSAENFVIPATSLRKQCYSQMFQGCTSLTKTPKAIGSSAMTWNGGDYVMSDMFHGCTSLTTVPSGLLPALNLGNQCYWYMFEDCSSLTETPHLLATEAATQCYQGMFKNCSSLNNVTCLLRNPSTYNEWLVGVAANGTFYKNSNATWSIGSNGIPTNWTIIDYTT